MAAGWNGGGIEEAGLRELLVELAAAQVVTADGAGLDLRRLADDAKVPLETVIDLFGGTKALMREVHRAGFVRLARRMARVHQSDDPAADLFVQAWVYYQTAVERPDLYRVRFADGPNADSAEGEEDLAVKTVWGVVGTVQRCIAAGLFNAGDPVGIALTVWSSVHAAVMMELDGVMAPGQGIETMLATSGDQFGEFGMPEAAVADSLAAARRRFGA